MAVTPIIRQTPRLLLKGLSPQDMTVIFENLPKAEIMQLLGHQTDEDFQLESDKQQNGYAAYNRQFIVFLLIEKASGEVVGRCGLHNWNKDQKRAEIGYQMNGETYKRKGFMTEAVSAIIDYGFNELQLHRIEALVGSRNVPSLRIIEGHNFVKEGLMRQHYCVDGVYEDSVVFSKLRSEYLSEPARNS